MPTASRRARIVRQERGGSRWEVATRALPARLAPYTRDLMGYGD